MTNKELENYIDAGYEKCDQQEFEERQLGLINYGDEDYYFQHPEEYEKDKRIAELEEENAMLKEFIVAKTAGRNYGKTIASKLVNYDNILKANEELKEQLKTAKIDTLNRLRECIYDADKYVCITDEVLLHIIDSLRGEEV